MIKKKALAASLLALLSLTTSVSAEPLTRGDYNNDGLSDLAVALRRSNTRTEFATRITGSGEIIGRAIEGSRGDAIASARYQQGVGSLFGIVSVITSATPLRWSIVLNNNSVVNVSYGLPGDRIINAFDADGDGVDDFLVVRNGPGNALTWYFALSGFGGGIVSTVFGQNGDAPFTFYDNGLPRIGVARLGAGDVINWFSKSPFGTDVDQDLWGVKGDIPLVRHDMNGDGSADLIVARKETTNGLDQQTLYVALGNSAQFYTVGRATSIPFIGNFSGGPAHQVGWVQRDGAGNNSLVGIRDGNGNVDVRTFGINDNIIVRPDYSVVERNSDGTFGGGGGGEEPPSGNQSCSSILTRGWLWKPESQDSGGTRQGKPLILTTSSSLPACLSILAANGAVISEIGRYASNRAYSGWGCGDGETGPQMRSQAIAATGGDSTIYVRRSDGVCYGPVPNPAARKDNR